MRTGDIKTAEPLPLPLRKKGIQEEIARICRDNDIVRLAIFGSFARGDQTAKSDVDILITFKREAVKTLFDLVEIESELKKVFNRKVDLVTADGLSPLLKEEILSSARVVYAE
jgi:hypothetical protein